MTTAESRTAFENAQIRVLKDILCVLAIAPATCQRPAPAVGMQCGEGYRYLTTFG